MLRSNLGTAACSMASAARAQAFSPLLSLSILLRGKLIKYIAVSGDHSIAACSGACKRKKYGGKPVYSQSRRRRRSLYTLAAKLQGVQNTHFWTEMGKILLRWNCISGQYHGKRVAIKNMFLHLATLALGMQKYRDRVSGPFSS
jgi:hypothetical protein